jgi:tagatose 6-phosphate kinase
VILVVNLNAALDKTYVMDDLRFGHVNRVKSVRTLAGGKGNNVARALASLGHEVLVTGFAGGANGQFMRERLSAEGIDHDYLMISQESRVCLAMPTAGTGRTTEVLEPGPVISQSEAVAFRGKLLSLVGGASVVVLSGSLPRGLEPGYYANLLGICRGAGCLTVLDTSGDGLRIGLEARPDVVKPNRDELGQLMGETLNNRHDIARAAGRLVAAGIGLVLVSLGEEGAVAATAEGAWTAELPPVRVVNSVGSGDAMVAAVAIGLAEKYSIEDTLALAVAAGAANCLTMGGGQLRAIDVTPLRAQARVQPLA